MAKIRYWILDLQRLNSIKTCMNILSSHDVPTHQLSYRLHMLLNVFVLHANKYSLLYQNKSFHSKPLPITDLENAKDLKSK